MNCEITSFSYDQLNRSDYNELKSIYEELKKSKDNYRSFFCDWDIDDCSDDDLAPQDAYSIGGMERAFVFDGQGVEYLIDVMDDIIDCENEELDF